MHASSNGNGALSNSRRLWYVALFSSALGLAFAGELTRIHVRLQADPTHRSVCNINASVNCDAVATSDYSVFLGLPLSVWGMFAYAAALAVAVWGIRKNDRPAIALLWSIGAVCMVSAVGLAAVSAFVLKVWCLFCMFTWVVDAVLFVVATRLLGRCGFAESMRGLLEWLRHHVARSAVMAGLGAASLVIAYRAYGHPATALSQKIRAASRASDGIGAANKPPEGIDASGLPFVGAMQPKLVITEFSDYQCPHCARAHELLRGLVAVHSDAIRVVHRHFPLDNDCNPKIKQVFHTHACYYARLAVCAATLGKFWPGNDYLFTHGRGESPVTIESFARAIEVPPASIKECLASKADAILRRDLEAGSQFDIDGTPTFIIRGEKYTGELPEDVLRDYPL